MMDEAHEVYGIYRNIVDDYMSGWVNAEPGPGGLWTHVAGPSPEGWLIIVDVDGGSPERTVIRVGAYSDPSVDNDPDAMLYARNRDELHRAFCALLTYADPIPEE